MLITYIRDSMKPACDCQQDLDKEAEKEDVIRAKLLHKALCLNSKGAIEVLLNDKLYDAYLK